MLSSHIFWDNGTDKWPCINCPAHTYEYAPSFVNYIGRCGNGQLMTATEERTQLIQMGFRPPLMGYSNE